MALGIAEYRSGNYAAADRALLAAVKAGLANPHVTGTAPFFRRDQPVPAGKCGRGPPARHRDRRQDEAAPRPTGKTHWESVTTTTFTTT